MMPITGIGWQVSNLTNDQLVQWGCLDKYGNISFGQTVYVANGLADNGPGIAQAIQDLPSITSGGSIILPQGTINVSTGITIDRPVKMEGQSSGFNGRGTQLVYSGTGILLSLYANSDGSQLRNFSFTNVGTGTVGIDIDNGPYTIKLYNVNDAANTPWSVAAIRIGNTTTGAASQNLSLDGVTIYNEKIAVQAKRVINLVINNAQLINDTVTGATYDLQLGDVGNAAYKVTSVQITGSTLGTPANADLINIQNALDVSIIGCNFENDGTGYAVNISGTALQASGIFLYGNRYQASGVNATTRIVNVGISSASLFAIGGVTDNQYAAGTNFITNSILSGNAGHIYVFGVQDVTGNVNISNSLTNLFYGPGFLNNTNVGLYSPDKIQTKGVAFGSLPACNAAAEGSIQAVTDSNSAVFNAAMAGAGANHVIAYCNGTAWVVH